MYSPVPIENAPATSAATPVSTVVCSETPPPPTPAISEALVTKPSTAPNTVGRNQPPDTSRCPCDQPARKAAAPVAWEGSRGCSALTPRLSPDDPCALALSRRPRFDQPAERHRRTGIAAHYCGHTAATCLSERITRCTRQP